MLIEDAKRKCQLVKRLVEAEEQKAKIEYEIQLQRLQWMKNQLDYIIENTKTTVEDALASAKTVEDTLNGWE